MKIFRSSIIALLLMSAVAACSKDEIQSPSTPNQPVSLEGKWEGAYGFGSDNPSIYYSFNIKPGGVIEEIYKSGQSKGSGSWTLTGNSFKAKYKWTILGQTTYSVAASLDPVSGKLTGTWGYDNSATDGGKWTMHKKN